MTIDATTTQIRLDKIYLTDVPYPSDQIEPGFSTEICCLSFIV